MADPVPAGAFPECEAFEQQLATTQLGGPKKAFTSRRDSLAAMRTTVNAHEGELGDLDKRMTEIEEVVRNRPF